ncbi:MAG: hypothetical protein ACR2P0_12880 [Acidimicrobiales bacterium]
MTATNWNVEPARIDRNWRAITVELDAPRPSRLERMLRAMGFPAHLTRVMVATPGLRRAWFLATGVAMFVGMGVADGTRENLFALLLIAPLIPVLGVAFSYGVEADPAHEAAMATPIRGIRLIVTRSAVILAVSVVLLAIASLLAPGTSPMSFAWLLPALGLTSATVALMSFISPRKAAGVSTSVWVVGVTLAQAGSTDRLAAFTAGGQVFMLFITMAAMGVMWFRRDRFDMIAVGA